MTTTHLRAEAEAVQEEAGGECTTRAALLIGAADAIDSLREALKPFAEVIQNYPKAAAWVRARGLQCPDELPKTLPILRETVQAAADAFALAPAGEGTVTP